MILGSINDFNLTIWMLSMLAKIDAEDRVKLA